MTEATGPLYNVAFRRRREGKTNYRRRLALLKSKKPRLVVRKSNRYVRAAFTAFEDRGDKVLASAVSKELGKFGFKGKCNTPSAYLTGLLAGKRASKAGVKEFVLDIGLHNATKGSLVFAALKGAVDAGLSTAFDEKVLPSEDRIGGKYLNAEVQSSFAAAKEKVLKG
jgi:large subunit ribosomal protein L18